MVYGLLAVAFLLLWAAAAFLIQTWLDRPKRPSLAERLAPFQRPWVADEAQRWLQEQDR